MWIGCDNIHMHRDSLVVQRYVLVNISSNPDSLILQLQQSTSREQIEHGCKSFCQSVDVDNYLLFGTIFTSMLSAPTCTLGGLGKFVRNRQRQIETITQNCMNTTSPIIAGDFPSDSPLNSPLLKPIRKSSLKGVSISFPVHYPMGKFAFLHIATTRTREDNEQYVMDIMVRGHRFAHEAGDAILRLLESELKSNQPYLAFRERQCLLLASDGATPQQIAQQLGLSSHTVNYHLKNAREKLGSKNIPGAVSKAILRGEVKTLVDSERNRG